MFLVFALFQFHSLGIKSISWYDFGVAIFFPVIAIQNEIIDKLLGRFLDLLLK